MSNIDHSTCIVQSIQQSIALKNSLINDEDFIGSVNKAAEQCIKSIQQNNRILLAGNGGSAADAQHIAAELVCRFNFERPGLAAMALATNYSVITAAGNDYSFDDVFKREVEANGAQDDVFIAISTSGNSTNIIKAVKAAQQKGIFVIGLSGEGGELQKQADLCISIPSTNTPRVQECHILVGHIICEIIENHLFKNAK